ncbi:MAG: lysophospholipid acyltransferase family protein [Eubacteriales bacterium]
MEVNYDNVTPYDVNKTPRKQLYFLTCLAWFLSKLSLARIPHKIEKINMEKLKPPYILLSNHMFFIDFKVNSAATFPHRVTNIVAIDGYYKRPWLMELLGCICKRKFTTDIGVIRNIKHALNKNKSILCIYPEARYSPVGTTAILPDSLGSMVKMMGVPLAVLLHHGNYLYSPFWDRHRTRKVPLHATMTQVLTAEQVKEMTPDEINRVIKSSLAYNEYTWQLEKGIRITEPYRAEGLHKVLFICPHCLTESKMTTSGTCLRCSACNKAWQLGEDGRLTAEEGETYFSHIPDWFEWERSQVRRQIEEGIYKYDDTVEVYSQPSTDRFIPLGFAHLTHTPDNGFVLEGTYNNRPYSIVRTPLSMYSLHVEYDFICARNDDCIDISTEDDSFYCYPSTPNVITKLSFATEEMYKIAKERQTARRRTPRVNKEPVHEKI